MSLPLWERGLKLAKVEVEQSQTEVAPLVGAWVEILCQRQGQGMVQSLPLWERGLKFAVCVKRKADAAVAPLVGAWVEISCTSALLRRVHCRSPCGSVG